MNRIKIMGISLPSASADQSRQTIKAYLKGNRARQIVTVNPEFLLAAQTDDAFSFALNQADWAVADGIGLFFAGLAKGVWLSRLSGADLVPFILAEADKLSLRLCVLNWAHGLSSAEQIKRAVNKLAPNCRLRVYNIERGGKLPEDYKIFDPQVVLIALGAPWQDVLAGELKACGKSLRLTLGIGGSLDFLTGQVRRAPLIFRKFGFEWLWRLLINPKQRLSRIWQAVIIFPLRFLQYDWLNRWLYRPNVVGFLYQGDKVLIVNSNKDERDFWKLPQGGVNGGENLEKAVRREMNEELSTADFTIKAVYPNVYHYRWPKHYNLGGYKGQRQNLFLLEYHGRPEAIKLSPENRDYKWVAINDLLNQVNPIVREAYTIFLEKFALSHPVE